MGLLVACCSETGSTGQGPLQPDLGYTPSSWESGAPEHGLCVAAASGAQQSLLEPQLHPEAPTVRCRWCGCLGCSWNPQAVASR